MKTKIILCLLFFLLGIGMGIIVKMTARPAVSLGNNEITTTK